MFTLLQLAAQVFLNLHNTDEDSCRAFLKELILLVKARAAEIQTQLDDTELKSIEFVLNDNGLFGYTYWQIYEQCQTPEILFESVNEDTIIGLVEDAAENNPEVIDPVVIVSLVSQIISIINTIKANRNRNR